MSKVTYTHVFDAKMATNIGEDSVSNVVQAVLELAKNSYDADALNIIVKFDGTHSSNISEDEKTRMVKVGLLAADKIDEEFVFVDKVSIIDDGVAMTDKDLKEKYFRLGTATKVLNILSPKLRRRVVGEKGMGHYAAKRIGDICTIISNPVDYEGREFSEDFDKTITVTIDWTQFQQGRNFTDIESEGEIAPRADPDSHGLTIELTGLRDKVWSMTLISHTQQALGMLQLPKELADPDSKNTFRIKFQVPTGTPGQYSEETEVDHSPLDSALFKVVGKIEGKTLTTRIYQNKEDKLGDKLWDLVETIKDPKEYVRPCGDASIEIYHYPEDVTFKVRQLEIMGQADVRKFLMGPTMKFDAMEGNSGVKIFNDNVRIMPFGERSHQTLWDWAGLDKRALQKGGGKIRQHRLVGFVRLTRKSNPEISEVSTREGIKQNAAFSSLVEDLVKPTLVHLEKYKISVKKSKVVTIVDHKNTAKKKIAQLEQYLKQIPMDDEDRAVIHDTLSRTAHHISAFAREEAEEKEELVGSLEMLRALSSLGISTLAFAHETQPKLNSIRSGLIGLEGLEGLADKSRERLRAMISTMNEIQSWNEFLDIYASALSSAKSTTRLAKTEINLREMLKRITDSLDSLAVVKTGAEKTKIQFNTSILGDRANKIYANEAAIISVFTNLFLNSIKSLRYVRRTENPSISVDISTDGIYLVIQVHDNGKGIEGDNVTGQRGTDKITEAFYSSYPKEGPLKGMGLGMTLVREIVEEQYRGELSLKATTYDDDKPGNGSATFEIRIPLKELKREPVKDVK